MRDNQIQDILSSSSLHAFSIKPVDRIGPEIHFQNYNIISARSEDWVNYFPDLAAICIPLEDRLDQSLTEQKLKTSKVLKSSTFTAIAEELKIENLLIYKPFMGQSKVAKENHINILANNYLLSSKFENKYLIRQKYGDQFSFAPFELITNKNMPQSNEVHKKLANKFGKYLLQDSELSGGLGTYVIKNDEDFHNAISKLKHCSGKIVASKFIDGLIASVQCCIADNTVLSLPIQRQVIGAKELTAEPNQFCGGQWAKNEFTEIINKKAKDIANEVGEVLLAQGYKGIFGIDLIVDKEENNVYLIEINPRITGMTLPLTLLFNTYNLIPFITLHIIEFLGLEYQLPENYSERINKFFSEINHDISYAILFNNESEAIEVKKPMKPGLYKSRKNPKRIEHVTVTRELNRIRELSDLIILETPNNNKYYQPGARMTRFLTNNKLLDKNDPKQLNDFARKTIGEIRDLIN